MSLDRTAPEYKKAIYRPDIDGLRAIAIVPVIINHFHKDWLPSGFLGVDIFFVISGVVITGSLLHQSVSGFSGNLLHFYSRRVKRLLPALCCVVVVGAILISLFNPYPGFSLQTGVTALFGFSNLYLFFQSTDYFAPSAELNIFTHTWSLGVEEQFYLLFPLLLWVAGPWRSSAGFTRQNIRLLTLFILCFSVASLILFVALSTSHPAAAYFLMPTRFWEMGAGCLLALWSHQKNSTATKRSSSLQGFISYLPLLAVLAVFKLFSEDEAVYATIAIVALTCVLVAISNPGLRTEHNRRFSVYHLLAHPFLIAIGLLSYSLYLWHWPVLCISRWTIGTPIWSIPFLLVLIVALSLMSFILVEQPLRKAAWAVANVNTILRGLVAASFAAVSLLVLGGPLKGKLFTGKGGAAIEANRLTSKLIKSDDSQNQQLQSVLKECNATPFMLGANSYSLNRKLDREFIQDCLQRIGIPAGSTLAGRSRLILLGDSFAEKLAPFAALAARKIGHDFHVFFGYGCPYLLRSDLIRNTSFPRCRYLSETMLEEAVLAAIKPGDIVVLRLHTSSKSYVHYPSGSAQPRFDVYDEAIQDLMKKIQATGASFVFVGGNPNLSTQEFAALRPDWFNAWNRSDTIDPRNSQETKFFHSLDRHLVQRYGSKNGGIYFSVKPYFCAEGDKCLLSVGDKFLYQDDHHLSLFGHELFFPAFLGKLRSLAGLPISPPS